VAAHWAFIATGLPPHGTAQSLDLDVEYGRTVRPSPCAPDSPAAIDLVENLDPHFLDIVARSAFFQLVPCRCGSINDCLRARARRVSAVPQCRCRGHAGRAQPGTSKGTISEHASRRYVARVHILNFDLCLRPGRPCRKHRSRPCCPEPFRIAGTLAAYVLGVAPGEAGSARNRARAACSPEGDRHGARRIDNFRAFDATCHRSRQSMPHLTKTLTCPVLANRPVGPRRHIFELANYLGNRLPGRRRFLRLIALRAPGYNPSDEIRK